MNNAVYLLTAKASGQQVLIDAADDVESLAALLEEGAADAVPSSASLRFILTTHAHWDHTRAVGELASRTGASIAIGAADADQLRQERDVDADVLLHDGDTVNIEGVALDVIGLRGHTPGSMAFATSSESDQPTLLFTGDSLFPGGVGNTGNDRARFTQLITDVSERIFDRFDDSAKVLPGHGDATTIGTERPSLPEWRERGW